MKQECLYDRCWAAVHFELETGKPTAQIGKQLTVLAWLGVTRDVTVEERGVK